MTFSPRRVTDTYAVLGQLQPSDLAKAKQLGYQSIINNRPDDEEADQPKHELLAQAAQDAGLKYLYLPVSGPISSSQIKTMQHALVSLPQPVLAFCRSGARSTRIWAHAQHGQQSMDDILQAAEQAGGEDGKQVHGVTMAG